MLENVCVEIHSIASKLKSASSLTMSEQNYRRTESNGDQSGVFKVVRGV